MAAPLSTHQFKGHMTKDPVHDKRPPKFGGGKGSKTMLIESKGLPTAPKIHPHRRHAGKRTRRAR